MQWQSLAERERCWDAFSADPGWLAARADTERDGPIVRRFTSSILRDVPSITERLRSASARDETT